MRDSYRRRRITHGHIGTFMGMASVCLLVMSLTETVYDDLVRCLDPDHSGTFSRPDALQRLAWNDALPVRDHDGALIVGADVERVEGVLSVKSLQTIVSRDCGECGYDRATRTYDSIGGGAEHSVRVTCNACDNVIEEHSSL